MGLLIAQAGNAIFGWLSAWINGIIVDLLAKIFTGA
jgi:hypothetical protein